MLAIEVEFLTGRYVATAYNSRQDVEWPPEPARLFSALTATHFAADPPAVDERAVLEWLEAQGAPAIAASDASTREIVTVFVPVNDAGKTDVDAEAAAVETARAELATLATEGDAKAVKKANKAVSVAEKKLQAAIGRATAVPKGAASPLDGRRVLPEFRGRQPRTFPSVTPHVPRVTYSWPEADPASAQRQVLDGLLARLVRLGHSSSLVSARLVETVAPTGGDPWRPAADGEEILRTVQGGQLAALERQFALHRETEPRVMPSRFQGYTRRSVQEEEKLVRSSFAEDWVVLRRVGGPTLPMVASAGVARTVRKALMSHAAQPVAEVLSGHTADGRPSTRDHLAIVPLPFVGHAQASGAILGVALVLPRDASDADRRAVYGAVDAWERAARQQDARQKDQDTPRLSVRMGAAGVLDVERVEYGAVQASLRPATWCRPATAWSSATPVALDRNPGDLRSRDGKKLSAALEEATTTLRAACVRIGLPEPVAIDVLPAAPLAGATKARLYPGFPEEPGKTRRVLTHVRLRFAEEVGGPVLLGAGRYLGLGLLRPEVSGG